MTLRPQYVSYNPDRDIEVPILEEPREGAKEILLAGSFILAKDPLVEKNLFIQVLCMNMRLGWIERRFVRPWSIRGDARGRCTPVMMSDGSPGYR